MLLQPPPKIERPKIIWTEAMKEAAKVLPKEQVEKFHEFPDLLMKELEGEIRSPEEENLIASMYDALRSNGDMLPKLVLTIHTSGLSEDEIRGRLMGSVAKKINAQHPDRVIEREKTADEESVKLGKIVKPRHPQPPTKKDMWILNTLMSGDISLVSIALKRL